MKTKPKKPCKTAPGHWSSQNHSKSTKKAKKGRKTAFSGLRSAMDV